MHASNTRALCALFAGALLAACGAGDLAASTTLELAQGSIPNATTQDANGVTTRLGVGSPMTRCPDGGWCSSLYPATWSAEQPADSAGRFLHDFSYAGYHAGELPPASPAGATYDVVATYRADATGGADATSAIQSAIDAASIAQGGIVFFPAGTYRIDGVLKVTGNGVVLRGTGRSSLLRFTKSRGLSNAAHLTFAGAVARETPRALAADAPERTRELLVTDAAGLTAGDDVAVGWTITPAFVAEHGMTGTWTSFNGDYKPFFRRRVVSVDTSATPHRVILDVPIRYSAKTRNGAAIQKETGYLHEVGVEHLGMTNAVTWDEAWAENHVNALTLRDVADAWVSDVHSMPPPGVTDPAADHLQSAGILVESSNRVSVLGTTMENPQNRGSGGNGYLFEVSRTSEVLFADCEGRHGRHNFIQNWGFGNSGTVFLRCTSTGSEMLSLIGGVLKPEPALSEHHHSLAMATLVDSCQIDDGFGFENRGAYSTGAGQTATESVVWRPSGTGKIKSRQYGWGYVIGAQAGVSVETGVDSATGAGTAPEDFVEGKGQGETLYPASLYDDQRARRLPHHVAAALPLRQ
jgi:hypothetical protein